MSANSLLKKQRGSISLLGVLSIVTSLSGFYMVMELGNKMIMDRNFDNYAEALAPVALRTELALTQDMIDAGEGDKVRVVMADFLGQLGYTLDSDITVNIKFGNMVTLDAPVNYTNPKTGLTYTLNDEFVPLDDSMNPSNPKVGLAQGEDPPEFSAVAIELVESNPSSLLGFHPKGRAIYGIPPAEVASADMSACFCDSRYESCLVADFSDVAGFPGILGAVGSAERQNYCEYGYVSSQQAGVAKFPSVMLYSQWLGKTVADDGTPLIDKTDPAQLANYETVVKQKPLFVQPGINPFETNTGSSVCSCGFGSGGDYLASKWDGNVYERGDVPSGLRTSSPPDYNYTASACCTTQKVKVDGYFYVGRTGVCIAGTTAADVPNISGGVSDVSLIATSSTENEVQRCLSYQTVVGTTTTTTTVPDCPIWNPFCGATKEVTTTTDVTGYAQQSCRDFNSKSKARLSFFEWMISLFFGGLTDWNISYQQLDCGIKKMQSYPSFSFFNWW